MPEHHREPQRTDPGISLDRFNAAEGTDLEQLVHNLTGLFGSPELAHSVVANRPYASLDELCDAADCLLAAQSDEVVMAAVRAHPPIGATAAPGSLSEAEQSVAAASSDSDQDRVRALNPVYEKQFGYVFLIRAAGLSANEVLAALEKRLGNDPETEWAETRSQLAGINSLRLRGFVQEGETR